MRGKSLKLTQRKMIRPAGGKFLGQVTDWGVVMLYYALVFLILAVVAGFFGFGGVAGTATWIAQVLFVFFLVGLVISVLYNALHGKRPT